MTISNLTTSEIKIVTPLWLVKHKTTGVLKFACKAYWCNHIGFKDETYITFIHFARNSLYELHVTRTLHSGAALNYEYVNDIRISPKSSNKELAKYLT